MVGVTPDEVNLVCPNCGCLDFHEVSKLRQVETLENVAGGTDDFLETWQRYTCDNCDQHVAVRENEESL